MDDLHEIVLVDVINLLPVFCNNLNKNFFGRSKKIGAKRMFLYVYNVHMLRMKTFAIIPYLSLAFVFCQAWLIDS